MENHITNENCCYVYLTFGHRSFTTGRTAIVAVPRTSEFLEEYAELAKEKVCERLKLNKDDVVIFDYKVLGDDVLILS